MSIYLIEHHFLNIRLQAEHIAQSLLRHAGSQEEEGAKDQCTFEELNFAKDKASREAWRDTRLSIHEPAFVSGFVEYNQTNLDEGLHASGW